VPPVACEYSEGGTYPGGLIFTAVLGRPAGVGPGRERRAFLFSKKIIAKRRKIIEHWDVLQTISQEMAHGNTIF
jgi:hypothetical protein